MNRRILELALLYGTGMTLPGSVGVSVPKACEHCEHRQEDMRDGGWCYMFREAPQPTCAQFKPIRKL